MDTTTTSPERELFLDKTWETKFTEELTRFRSDFSLQKISLFLPLGFNLYEGTFSKLPKEFYMSKKSRGPHRFVNMILSLEKTYSQEGSIRLILSQTIPTALKMGFKVLKPDFSYDWNYDKKHFTIFKYLAQLELDLIEKNIALLAKECLLFMFLYKDEDDFDLVF